MVTFQELFRTVDVVKTVLDVVTSQAGVSPPTTPKAKDPMLNRYNDKVLQPAAKVLDRLKLGIKNVNECLRNIETSPLLENLSVRTVTRLGVFYYYAERYDDALFIWNAILEEFPDDLRSLNNKALLLRASDSQTAICLLKEALRIYPEYLDAKVNMAGVLVDSDDPVEAINILEPLVDEHREDKVLLRNLMLSYSKIGNVEKTLECYDWLKGKVSERELQNNIGVAYLHSGMPKEALDAFTCALECEPENVQSKINRAVAMLEMGLTLVPEYILKELHSQRTDNSVMTNLAMVYLKKKQFDLAIAWGLKSLTANKEDLVALNLVGLGYNSFGDYLEAIEYYDMALAIRKSYLPALGNKANSLMFLGKFDDALHCLLEFREYDPNDKVVNDNIEWLQKKIANHSKKL
jgi:tetratricopeptide (TPR) repeat protein